MVKSPQPNDLLFPGNYLKMFNNLLDSQSLKLDRDDKPRTAYSFRHTYICLRLMEGADVYAIAKNCRTSVEMIEKSTRHTSRPHWTLPRSTRESPSGPTASEG